MTTRTNRNVNGNGPPQREALVDSEVGETEENIFLFIPNLIGICNSIYLHLHLLNAL